MLDSNAVSDADLAAIVELPTAFKTVPISIRDAVAKSGYAKVRRRLTIEGLPDYLRRHSELIQDWRRYSEGKRTSSGWYLLGDSSWVVGYIGSSVPQESQSFQDAAKACATFILNELDGIVERTSKAES
jgi:hypothetical protein